MWLLKKQELQTPQFIKGSSKLYSNEGITVVEFITMQQINASEVVTPMRRIALRWAHCRGQSRSGLGILQFISIYLHLECKAEARQAHFTVMLNSSVWEKFCLQPGFFWHSSEATPGRIDLTWLWLILLGQSFKSESQEEVNIVHKARTILGSSVIERGKMNLISRATVHRDEMRNSENSPISYPMSKKPKDLNCSLDT